MRKFLASVIVIFLMAGSFGVGRESSRKPTPDTYLVTWNKLDPRAAPNCGKFSTNATPGHFREEIWLCHVYPGMDQYAWPIDPYSSNGFPKNDRSRVLP